VIGMPSEAEQCLIDGDPAGALEKLQRQVRERPGDAKLRVFLFQLLCVLGQWQRAMAQLAVCGQLDPGTLAMVNTYREALKAEVVREAVFAGRTTPVVFGQPAAWIAKLVQALAQEAGGDLALAQHLRASAFDEAPASSGTLNGTPFDWIADADSRLGPLLEVVLNGRYTWLPFDALAAISLEVPEDLRDLVWMPAHLSFTNRGESVALVPTCYPGTQAQADPALRMARSTQWRALGGEQYAGFGQRTLASSGIEIGLLESREIRLGSPATP
jgi:type VI secretion system protein ImpE